MLPVILLLSLRALVLTQAADMITTMRGIRRCGSIAWERNPLACWAMSRWGLLAGGMSFVMALWVLVVALFFVPAWFAPGWYQWATALSGFLIAWAQWDVARMNATGRCSRFTRQMLSRYQSRG